LPADPFTGNKAGCSLTTRPRQGRFLAEKAGSWEQAQDPGCSGEQGQDTGFSWRTRPRPRLFLGTAWVAYMFN